MDHNDIRHKLSDYIDGSVSPDERTAIEEHLKTCRTCSDALHELQKTVEHIKSVEEVEPPAWMTQKIMAQVRSEAEEKKGLFQRMFYPLSLKLPIQAVAVLFLAVTAFYIYRNIQPAPMPSEAPVQEFAARSEPPPVPVPRERSEEPKITKEAPVPAKKIPQAPEYKALDMKLEYEKPAPPKALGKAAESASAPSAENEAFKHAQEAEKSKRGLMQPQPPASAEKRGAPMMGLTAGGAPREEGTAPVARAKASLAEGRTENAVDLTMKVKEFDATQKEIEKAVTASGGKIIGTAPPADKSVITISIDRYKFAELLSKLKTIGDVKENIPAPISGEGYATIRITLTIN